MTKFLNPKIFDKDVEQVPTRNGYGDGLLELGARVGEIVVLTGDLKESTRVEEFAKRFPERFIECGVAEQNMMGIAAGLASAGKIPFVSSYAVFSPGRSWDQLRVSVCYSNLNVNIVGAHTGVSVGPDGATHQALEDIAITRVLPNMTVVVPCDYWETKKATLAAASRLGPYYSRFTREKTPVMTTEETPFEIGKAAVFADYGDDAAILACGPLVYQSLVAAKELEKEGIKVRVINNHTIKPMDVTTVMKAARDCGAIVTVEEHQVMGGMGSAVAEILVKNYPVPMEFIGMPDAFGESGQPEELLEKYGMSVREIKEAVRNVILRKRPS
ncbi:MAG: Transketolase central region [Candidatus Amesbacteria bacterium GW2011_GWA2_47_11b]|uniref:Transketolase central region n=2 Tax=Candidatus Amesiibacteriota TaxID=1752730 RepID=A0A0G1SJS2_9BACT|nr:MAG: Transketolase central region [Microgenomates group bacterium GW2011_GWC1_46_20]KKU57595.1 MAG: Transketolase central region [Candidatus Amesbacteria bacterium GW2011_GWA2_47_11b]KKU69662.1 MAG: Transketolase central region [Candidatus Amesbacteria bacterium GW2011_GWA1_47_20]